MPVITRPRNKETHPGYADLPDKRGREESEQDADHQTEPEDHNGGSSKPRKPPKRQKYSMEEERELYKLAKLQDKLTKTAVKNAAEAARPPGPQMAKVPRKLSVEAVKKLSEEKRRRGASRVRDDMDIEGENMEQDEEPVEKAVEKRGKSQELASAGRKKRTARDVINSHRLSIAAAEQDLHTADTGQNTDKEGTIDPDERPSSSIKNNPSSQQQPTGLCPDWRYHVAKDIPNADKRPPRSNSQVLVSQARKVSQGQQSTAPSEDNRRGEESQNEQIRADKLTYKPCNGIDDLENENPAPDDLPSLSPHRLTKVQHGKAASAKAIAPPYISSPLRFPSSSPPAASRTVKPPSFIRGTQNPLPNATDQVRPGDDTGDREIHQQEHGTSASKQRKEQGRAEGKKGERNNRVREEGCTGEGRGGQRQKQGEARKKGPKQGGKEDLMPHQHPDDADNEVDDLPSEDDRRNIPDSLDEQRPNRKLQKHGAPRNRPTALPSSGSESESNDSNYHLFSPIKNANACVTSRVIRGSLNSLRHKVNKFRLPQTSSSHKRLTRAKFTDVDLPDGTLSIFKTRLTPMFLNYVAALDNPWKVIPHLGEAQRLWSVCFPDSKHEVGYKGEPVFALLKQRVYDFRKGFAKRAELAVIDFFCKFKKFAKDPKYIASYVAWAIPEPADTSDSNEDLIVDGPVCPYMWEEVDTSNPNNIIKKGPFCHPVILNTFAWYLEAVIPLQDKYLTGDKPCGALALSTVACERAFRQWSTGYCIQPQLKRDDAFCVTDWGHPTAEVMESIDLLTDKQWEKIVVGARQYMGRYQAESRQQAVLRHHANGKSARAACTAPDSE